MPEKQTVRKAKELKSEGKAETTQAGPFVEEEMRHIRGGKHGARSTKQAIAIGLSKARESGVDLPPPKKGRAKPRTRKSAKRALARGKKAKKAKSPTRSRAVKGALKREGRSAASKRALSKQARSAAAKRRRSGKATASPSRKRAAKKK
ncbi:MAG: DUF6496 domain-containing protein [Thermoanaerobaculia bacterium]